MLRVDILLSLRGFYDSRSYCITKWRSKHGMYRDFAKVFGPFKINMRNIRSKCDAVFNKKTNRCVLRHGSVGRRLKGRLSKCNSYRDEYTGRCKSSKTSRPRIRSLICIPRKFRSIVEECECIRRWQKLTHLGSGAYGVAYHACTNKNSKDCNYVVKVQKNNATAKRELDAYTRLNGKTNIVPKLHAAWSCKGKMYLVIDKLYKCRISFRNLEKLLTIFLI